MEMMSMTSGVTAVILAAGEGRRLAPLTNTRPKPMLPVANRPILEYVIDGVVEAGIEHVVLVVGYKQERIRNHFQDGDTWGIDIDYVEQRTQLGTGHAVLQTQDVIEGPFIVLNGDRIVDASIVQAVVDAMQSEDGPVVSITSVEHPSTFGVVELRGNRIMSIEEKPLDPAPTALINAGVYGFDPTIFEHIQTTETVDGELSLPETLDDIAQDHPLRSVHYDGTWLDVTNLWDLPIVNAIQLHRERPRVDSEDDDPTGRDDDTVLGRNVHIDPSASIRGGVSVGDNAVIGANVVLEDTVILPDAQVDAGSVIRHAVIGANASVGANTTIQGGAATVIVEGNVYNEVKLGGVIGDNSHIGGATVFNPGAIVGDDASVEPGVVLNGWFESGAIVRRG